MDDVSTSKTLRLAKKAQKPENWIDLPDHIWIKVMKLLPWSDLNNMHLVCKKLNEVASNYVPHKLVIEYNDVDRVDKENDDPARSFDEIFIGRIRRQEEIQQITRIVEMIGVHVKKFTIRDPNPYGISRTTFYRLLLLLPNLEFLEIEDLKLTDTEEAAGKVKLPKLKTLKIGSYHDNTSLKFILEYLEGSTLRDIDLATDHFPNFFPFLKWNAFLKSHEKTVKKLKILNFRGHSQEAMKYFVNSEDLRLEYLKLEDDEFEIRNQKFLNFLGRQRASLKTLKLVGYRISNKAVNFICESLLNLETLKLGVCHQGSEPLTTESTDNLSKLENLKKLCINFPNQNFNFLSGIGLAVNENLRTLKAGDFQPIPTSFISTLPSFVPNLKK